LSYYKIADEILLGIDNERVSWSKNKYEFDENFFDVIKEIDVDKKIKIIDGDFHSLNSPIENDTKERNYISNFCKKDNYVIGIDSDEIITNAEYFQNWFNNTKPELDIICIMSSVYKVIDNKILVNQPCERAQIGTKLKNRYKLCRMTGNKSIESPLNILHFSWGRTRREILQKLENFGHSKDFNINEYMKIWDSVNLENFMLKKNLHPLKSCKNQWVTLKAFDINNIKLDKNVFDKLASLNVFKGET
jgi:hypothetical protein